MRRAQSGKYDSGGAAIVKPVPLASPARDRDERIAEIWYRSGDNESPPQPEGSYP